MTRSTNARIAGFTFLFYTAIGICSEMLMHHATNAESDVAILARIAQWLPALVFQVVLALWLLIKGVATPAKR